MRAGSVRRPSSTRGPARSSANSAAMASSPSARTADRSSSGKVARRCGSSSWTDPTDSRLLEMPDVVIDGAFSPDGKTVVTTGGDGAWLWLAANGAFQESLQGHTGVVTSVAFLSTGELVTAGADGALITWVLDDWTASFRDWKRTGNESWCRAMTARLCPICRTAPSSASRLTRTSGWIGPAPSPGAVSARRSGAQSSRTDPTIRPARQARSRRHNRLARRSRGCGGRSALRQRVLT